MFEWVIAVDLHAALRSTSHRAGLAKIEMEWALRVKLEAVKHVCKDAAGLWLGTKMDTWGFGYWAGSPDNEASLFKILNLLTRLTCKKVLPSLAMVHIASESLCCSVGVIEVHLVTSYASCINHIVVVCIPCSAECQSCNIGSPMVWYNGGNLQHE